MNGNPQVAVLIPCLNEEAAIAKVIRDFREVLPDAPIFVYDNGSTDRTIEVATAAGAIVRKVTGGVVSEVPVKTGIRDGQWVEIVEGLAAGDRIVTKAGAFVRDGDTVNPVLTTQ